MPEELIESPIDSKIKFQSTDRWMDDGTLLITASPQLAGDWKSRIIRLNQQEVCETPQVLLWQEWMNQMAGTVPDSPIPLTRLQEERLWEKVISSDLKEMGIKAASVRALVKGTSQAWELMQAYQIPLTELALGGEEGEALARWIRAVQMELKKQKPDRRMLNSEMPALASQALSEPMLKKLLPRQILLDGFESLTPIQAEILEKVEVAGCIIRLFEQAPTRTLMTAPDESSEQAHVVARIEGLLKQNPQLHIAIAVSESCDANTLQRLLDHTLVPESSTDPAFELQAVSMTGRKLSETPMVQQLLHLLSIAGKTTASFADFSPLLFSPWIRG
ncbi:hypothetical protein ACFL3K_02225, partial [Pseudomonadota bacterium]